MRASDETTFAAVHFHARPLCAVIRDVGDDFRCGRSEDDDACAAFPPKQKLTDAVTIRGEIWQITKVNGLRDERTIQNQIGVSDVSDRPVKRRRQRAGD